MLVVPLIERKRDGGALTPEEWSALVAAYTAGRVPDYQMAALLMAVLLRGLERHELAALTDAMLASGQRLSFDSWATPRVDKHSTGGVGDKVSLVLAPLVAACGVAVPMMSGRGLGHTGGTLDKLEAIPGFRTGLSLAEVRAQVMKIGCAMIGQTPEIAPADRRIYALRDVTGTVEAIPLIAASIMSKKLAEGLNALVLDVKRGSGAFLPGLEQSLELARTMIALGQDHGCPAHRHGSPAGPRLRQRARDRGGDPRVAGRGPPGLDGGDLRTGHRDAARRARGKDFQEGPAAARERPRLRPRGREVRAHDRGAGWQSRRGGGRVGAPPGEGSRGVQGAADRCRRPGRAEGGGAGRRGDGRWAPQGRRPGRSHRRLRDHGEPRGQGARRRADRVGVRARSGRDQARVRSAGSGDRGGGQAHGQAAAARIAPRDEGRCRRAHTSRFRTNFAFSSMNLRRGSTSSPISVSNSCDASNASSIVTWSNVRRAGSIVVLRS